MRADARLAPFARILFDDPTCEEDPVLSAWALSAVARQQPGEDAALRPESVPVLQRLVEARDADDEQTASKAHDGKADRGALTAEEVQRAACGRAIARDALAALLREVEARRGGPPRVLADMDAADDNAERESRHAAALLQWCARGRIKWLLRCTAHTRRQPAGGHG